MIRSATIEVSPELIEETVMTALEKQFHDTAGCLNKQEYLLHKRTEIALGFCYRAISQREGLIPKMILKSKR